MRVCVISLDFPPFRTSGLTIYAEHLVRQLAVRGHDVTVLAADRPAHASVDDIRMPDRVRVLRLPVGKTDWIGLGWQAGRYLRTARADFDVLHFCDVHFAYACPGAYVASAWQSFRQRLSSHHGRPYHTTRRNYLFRLAYYSAARRLLEARGLRRARHVVMPSLAAQAEFIQHCELDPAQTTLIYPGLDLERFRSLPDRSEARRRLGLPVDTAVVLYVGFSTPRKGVEYLAQAMSLLAPSTHLVMVGHWEPGYRERFTSALGAAQARTHILGYVPEHEILDCYAASDVLVLPSLLEGLGIPLVEAMAAGIPVVTTAGGAAAEVVGEAGLVVPAADSAALGASLAEILRDPARGAHLGHLGRQRARELFDPDRAAAQLESVYRQAREPES